MEFTEPTNWQKMVGHNGKYCVLNKDQYRFIFFTNREFLTDPTGLSHKMVGSVENPFQGNI
ncbi:MAG: hypothetical protein KAG34_04080, partial [Cocleimonas sp.]|nr:hypothetical protein [Cocleimonas sp.]